MTERTVTVFENFDAGEWGRLGSRQAGKVAPSAMFTARNMMVYPSALLGPRAGLRNLSPTGMPAGVCWAFGFNGTPGADLWFVIGAGVYVLSSTTGSAVAFCGNLAATPTSRVASVEVAVGGSSRTYLTVHGDKTYYIDHVAKTLTPIPGSPGGHAITKYGERLAVGGTDPLGRVHLSAPLDSTKPAGFADWPAEGYFDVGDESAVRFLGAQRGHLAIGKQDGTWWTLTGIPGGSGSLRRMTGGGVHPWQFYGSQAVVLGNDEVAFLPIFSDYPAAFNGATVKEERRLEIKGGAVTGAADERRGVVSRLKRNDESAYLLDNQVLAMNAYGVWTFHDLSAANVATFLASDGQGRLFFTDGGLSGVAMNVYKTRTDLHRPGFTSDVEARPGDFSDAPVDAYAIFPEIWDPQGREVRVRSVIVDFRKWDTGSAVDNRLDVVVRSLSRYQVPGAKDSAPQTWTEAGSEAPLTGAEERRILNFGDQGGGGGFQVRLPVIRGVAIRSITVLADVLETRAG